MNISFINESQTKLLYIFIEPSTDEFLLKPNDEIKIICESLEEITDISHSFCNENRIVIWLPRSTKGTIYINKVHIESLSETRFW